MCQSWSKKELATYKNEDKTLSVRVGCDVCLIIFFLLSARQTRTSDVSHYLYDRVCLKFRLQSGRCGPEISGRYSTWVWLQIRLQCSDQLIR